MSNTATFKRNLGLLDLTLIGVGSMIGSSWLFSSLLAVKIAGPAAWISWLIAAFASFFIAMTLAELGSALPKTGGLVRYPAMTHGPLIGFIVSFAAFIMYSCVAGLEAVAVRTYASAWLPALGGAEPTLLGWWFQAGLIGVFFLINYFGVKSFGKANSLVTVIKLGVPAVVIVTLALHFEPSNFTAHAFAPNGVSGITAAVSTAGLIFAFGGFQNIVMFSAEVRNPSRTITLAIFFSLLITTLVYVLLQVTFIGAVPSAMLNQGWGALQMSTPFADLASMLGLAWLVKVIMADALISPAGTGNVYLAATARQVYAWARNGTFFKRFTALDANTGVPRLALWLSLFMALFWTLPFPSWEALVQVNSAAGVMLFTLLPICVMNLRLNAPDLPWPYRIRGIGLIAPLAFVSATFIFYWVGWKTLSWMLGAFLLLMLVYCLVARGRQVAGVGFAQQLRSSAWIVAYFLGLMLISCLGNFGGSGLMPAPWDQALVLVLSLACFYWGVVSGIARAPQQVRLATVPGA
jgi:amino acid transporter